MRILGIIAEYDPFHFGHLHHLTRARELSRCDLAVIALAGGFSQRGEPMRFDKWDRARMALSCGADAVLELPALWAVRDAERFARGGVSLLAGAGADAISFGCETLDKDALTRLAEFRDREPPALAAAITEGLAEGLSHPRARARALRDFAGFDEGLLRAPNAILAVEYLRAIAAQGRPIETIPVERTVPHGGAASGAHESASALRERIRKGDVEGAAMRMPSEAARVLKEAHPARIASDAEYERLLLYRLNAMSEGEYSDLPDLSEGIERRLAAAARRANSGAEIVGLAKSKRVPRARLMRLCAHAMIGLTAALTEAYDAPPYARVLGFRREAIPKLAEWTRKASLPLVTEAVRLKDRPVFRLEARATDLWGLLTESPDTRRRGRDYTERIIVL